MGAFCRHCMLVTVKQSSSFSKKHQILSLQICVCQTVRLTRKPGRLQNLVTDAGICVYIVQDTWLPATWCSSSSHQWHMGKHITKLRNCWSMEKAVVCMRERTSPWTSAKLKPALFRANALHSRLFFRTTNSLRRKTRCFASFPSQLFKCK